MLILRSLKIQDFLSHKKTELTFQPGDKVLLDGVSGSGKSTIIDALIWALYGVGRVENRSLVRRGAKQAEVTVLLEDSGTYYEVVRTASSTGKHTVEVQSGSIDVRTDVGAGGVKETDKWIANDLLHASYDLFINSVAYPQGNRESFVNATSARRKELLLEILKTEDIASYAEKTKLFMADANATLNLVQAENGVYERDLVAGKEQIAAEKQIIQVRDQAKERVANEEKDVELAQLKHGELKTKASGRTKRDELLARKTRLYDRVKHITDTQINSFGWFTKETAKEWIDKQEKSMGDDPADKLTEAYEWGDKRNAIIADKPDIVDYSSAIQNLTKQMDELLRGTDCPSGDLCPYVRNRNAQVDYLAAERDKRIKLLAEQEEAVAVWEARIKALGPAPDVQKLIEEQNIYLAQKKTIETFKRDIQDQKSWTEYLHDVKALQYEIDAIGEDFPTDAEIAEQYALVQQLKSSLTNAREILAEFEGMLAQIQIQKQEQDRLRQLIQDNKAVIVAQTARVELLGELREAFGTNGIQAVALDYLLPALEDKVNEILGQLSDFRIRLDTQKSSTSGGQVEGLFITIKNAQAEEFSFDSYSGGEKLKITVAISEALATLQNVGFRILDELFLGLDEDSTESFAHVLSQVQGRFSQMLCISHLRQIKDLFEKQITITKLDGVSTVTI